MKKNYSKIFLYCLVLVFLYSPLVISKKKKKKKLKKNKWISTEYYNLKCKCIKFIYFLKTRK